MVLLPRSSTPRTATVPPNSSHTSPPQASGVIGICSDLRVRLPRWHRQGGNPPHRVFKQTPPQMTLRQQQQFLLAFGAGNIAGTVRRVAENNGGTLAQARCATLVPVAYSARHRHKLLSIGTCSVGESDGLLIQHEPQRSGAARLIPYDHQAASRFPTRHRVPLVAPRPLLARPAFPARYSAQQG
jgi:hypothetical protein